MLTPNSFGEINLQRRILLPFTAIVNMDKLKLAIIINAVNPNIGGLLVRGPKGSGKTTAIRALADVLPKIRAVKACPFNCNPYDLSNMCEKCSANHEKAAELSAEERKMCVIDLPLGATEDRVVGSLDIEKAIKYGIEALEPGILAEANQNVLYVDEINLLPDHIADDLLDVAATGWNTIEREGISVSHPSRFIFVGTMNPEEGELRPQLLDRFPLSVIVERIESVEKRMEVVRRNLEFEANPEAFLEKYQASQGELRKRIAQAKKILPEVEMPAELLKAICEACLDLKVDGMRPDIVISKTACTLAAFEKRTKVSHDDTIVASELALGHRTREGGFLEPAPPEEIRKTFLAKIKSAKYIEEKTVPSKHEEQLKEKKPKGRTMIWSKKDASKKEEKNIGRMRNKVRAKIWSLTSRLTPIFGFGKRLKRGPKDAPMTDGVVKDSKMRGRVFEESEPRGPVRAIPTTSTILKPPDLDEGSPLLTRIKAATLRQFDLLFKTSKPSKMQSCFVGKRAETITTIHRGRTRGWKIPRSKPRDIHLLATIRAAAKRQRFREKTSEPLLRIHSEDVREKQRLYRAPMTIVFLIDVSGSMLLSIEEVKEALLKLHRDAYRYRDKVGIVALKDMSAIVAQHPVTNLRVIANRLLNLKISGLTPLAAGMMKSLGVLKEAIRRDRSTIPVLVIITDGNANIPLTRSLETGEVRTIDEIRAIVREYEGVAVQDAFSVAGLLRKEGVNTIIVNTNPHYAGRETYGFAVTKRIATITNGRHHIVGRLSSGSELVEEVVEKIVEDQRLIAHASSHKAFD